MNGRCKDCVHWGGDDLTEAGPQTCNRIAYHRDAEQGSGDPAALSAMCGQEAGELITEPDFGCVLFEATDPKPRCPICNQPIVTTEFSPNHTPVHDGLGNLIGFRHGIPTASLMCVAGCHVAVRGQVNCADLALKMGLSVVPKEEG